MNDALMSALGCVLAITDLVFTPKAIRLSWTAKLDFYKSSIVAKAMIGDNGRAGVNAAAPVLFATLAYGSVAVIAILIGLGLGFDDLVRAAGLPVLAVGAIGGAVLASSIVLFMRPTSLVPPKLREERGWIATWWSVSRWNSNADDPKQTG